MSLELCVLGSGSSGNASLLRIDDQFILIDAGFGPRVTEKRLAGTGVKLADIQAILLTHADRDHFNPSLCRTLLQHEIKIFCHQKHRYPLDQAIRTANPAFSADLLHRRSILHHFDNNTFKLPLAGGKNITIKPISLAHDSNGSCGFLISTPTSRLGYATDLGRVPDELIKSFINVDLLAIECNYDQVMQKNSPRPMVLKKRITGGSGHLSNDESFNAIREIFHQSTQPPNHIVLLHLSGQCNDPKIVKRLFQPEIKISARLHITNQHSRTDWLSTAQLCTPTTGQQLTMFAPTSGGAPGS